MKFRTKITFILATIFIFAALTTPARAEDNTNCQYFYGGQVCGSSTPEIADTAGETDILLAVSATLYTTGLTSFVLAKNAKKFVPKI